ncbi:MAG: OmpA family protein [Planctomycetaceae bacterium]|nr:OmpA family protein [Planctomycetaceae bacterium]
MNWLRFSLIMSCCALAVSQVACNSGPRRQLRMSQHRAMRLYAESQMLEQENLHLASQMNQYQQSLSMLAQEKQSLENHLAQIDSNLTIANQRIDNLLAERSELHHRYKDLLVKARTQQNPLSNEATRKFQELARRYPDFEFDPVTGVSKFHSDILFASGSAELRESAMPLLRDLASIMNSGDARNLNLLVVGHTDDQPIANARINHPTNWHLSTNRANSVVLALNKSGIKDQRLGAAGYSENQPVVPNADSHSRQRNRRVEIFVLAPDALIAGWDPSNVR